jgi:hypothetical protein
MIIRLRLITITKQNSRKINNILKLRIGIWVSLQYLIEI